MLNSNNEIFIPIKGYESLYQISNLGYVINGRKRLKTYMINSGYECLKLTKDSERTSPLIHRLVAEHFIPNPLNLNEVNHIDGCKVNNHVSNLEWVSSKQNRLHAKETGLWMYNKPALGLKRKTNRSKYHNVSWDNQRNKWIGALRVDGKTVKQKRFHTEHEAAIHVNSLIDLLGLKDRPKNIIT